MGRTAFKGAISLSVILSMILFVTTGLSASTKGSVKSYIASELWRRGDVDDDVVFGVIGDLAVSFDEQLLYVLDQQLSEISVFNSDGALQLVKSVFGEGPGEVNQPNSIFCWKDGSVGLVQQFPPKIVMLNDSLQPLDVSEFEFEVPSDGGRYFFNGTNSTENVIVVGATFIENNRGMGAQTRYPSFVVFKDSYGTGRVVRSGEYEINFSEKIFREEMLDIPLLRWAVGGSGKLFVAPVLSDFCVVVYNSDGSLCPTIKEEVSIRKRTSDELVGLESILRSSFGNVPQDIHFDLSSDLPPIEMFLNGVSRRGSDEIWVRWSSGYVDEGEKIIFNVYSDEGVFRFQAEIGGMGTGDNDMFFFWGKDRVIQVVNVAGAYAAEQGSAGWTGKSSDFAMQIAVYSIGEVSSNNH